MYCPIVCSLMFFNIHFIVSSILGSFFFTSFPLQNSFDFFLIVDVAFLSVEQILIFYSYL